MKFFRIMKADSRPMTREVPKYPRTNYPVPKTRIKSICKVYLDRQRIAAVA